MVLALSIIAVFVVLPPLLLLLYPTSFSVPYSLGSCVPHDEKKWMNHADGLFLFTLGALMITKHLGEKFTFIMGTMIVTLVTASALLYFIILYLCN